MLAKKHISNGPSFIIILGVPLILGMLCFTFYKDIRGILLIQNNRTWLADNVVSTNKTIYLKSNPDVLVLCTPWGGLTNVKQRILGCFQSESQKYNTTDVRFLLPWLMAAPIAGPFIPLELVFKEDEFVNWAQSHGYSMFLDPSLKWDNLVGREIDPGQRRTVDTYHEHVTEWASHFNVTVVRQVGDLASLKSDFVGSAFVLRDDLLPYSGDKRIEDDCVVHARIEGDWKKHSLGNPSIYTPFETILSSINASKICAKKRLTVLTADIATVKDQCKECRIFNNTWLKYYIQQAAVDFHRALKADIFIGNVVSTFSRLAMNSRNFNHTFTYSEHNGESCLRPTYSSDYQCSYCSSRDGMVIQNACIVDSRPGRRLSIKAFN